MSRFLSAAVSDMRTGRETWRVFVALGGPAFAVAVVLAVLRFH
jgi:hypothetical protein